MQVDVPACSTESILLENIDESVWIYSRFDFVTLLVGMAATSSKRIGKPNIVLVFMEHFGWGEPSAPELDKLDDEGLRLTNFNAEIQCASSRSAIMIGLYTIRSGNGIAPLGEARSTCWNQNFPRRLSKQENQHETN